MRPLSDLPLFGQRGDSRRPQVRRQPAIAAYPDAPGFKAEGASKEAANAMAGTARTLRARALLCISRTPGGLTADEVAAELGASPFAVRPRITELNRRGQIERADERRRNASGMTATVWRRAKPLGFERKEGIR
jgi:hypothetical protein